MILSLFLFSYFGLQFYLGRLKLKGERKKNPRVREGTRLARDSATSQASVVWLGLPATSTQGWETLPSAFGGDRVSTGLENHNNQHSSFVLYCPSPMSPATGGHQRTLDEARASAQAKNPSRKRNIICQLELSSLAVSWDTGQSG